MRCLIPLLLACLPGAAIAGPFPPIAFVAMGYKEVTRSTLPATSDQIWRNASPTGYLAITADFNGDGKDDEARILANPQLGEARIVVVIVSNEKIDTYVLQIMDLNQVQTIGIDLVKAQPATGRKLPGIVVFTRKGNAEYNVLHDGEFIRAPMPAVWSAPL